MYNTETWEFTIEGFVLTVDLLSNICTIYQQLLNENIILQDVSMSYGFIIVIHGLA
jgi:hypothetical protein